ncbi:MAG TPA: transglycosylase domain-containing protein [Candidatus Limnocylindrales bacterium]
MGASRRPGGGGATTARRVAIAIPLVLFSGLIAVGLVAFISGVSAYAYYSEGLPDPRAQLKDLRFDQQTVIYDRSGKFLLARLGDMRRELATFAELPSEMLDATTSIEDKDFWINPGFDLPGFVSASLDTLAGKPRGGSTITQQLVRARLLPASAFEGDVYDRKIREIIQSIRLTQEFEGEAGKREIITAYLNQNFYGNRSYGVKAAAKEYFGKPLDQLTLAQYAVLAAIPQSPSRFDLVRNADDTPCAEIEGAILEGETANCPVGDSRLYVNPGSEIVRRRNYVLDLMKTRSVLTRGKYTTADFDAAKDEPVILADQRSSPWKAPHFVWQVRAELAGILCPGEDPATCEPVDTGGYRVTTTLNWDYQRITEKWVYVAAIGPNSDNPGKILAARKIGSAARNWILGLRGRNINNAAAAVMDYRTGQVLAYAGSASYVEKGRKKFQPQFDVLSDGWRQPGSAIKPVNYAIAIDDERLTASSMFMDVVTNFASRGAKPFTPTQADGLERGPVRLRSALQFSLNIPAIKATLENGLQRTFDRSREFGLRYTPGAVPVTSMGIGTLEVHPIDLLGAYGAIANSGALMPRTTILKVVDSNGRTVYPAPDQKRVGKQVVRPQSAYIITDILAGNTDKRINPYWGDWQIVQNGRRRPAAYKTGTTSDNRDVHAYGYLAPPRAKAAPALAVGVWMGNSDNSPNNGSLSLDSSAPLWSAILTEISRGLPIASFQDSRPDGLVTATVDAFTGLRPGPSTTKTVRELFIDGTVPRERDQSHVSVAIDAATGGRWAPGCAGPRVVRHYLSFRDVEPEFPQWQRFTQNWAARAAAGRRSGGPEGTRPTYFYNSAFAPFGRSWGGSFPPARTCTPPRPEPTCEPVQPDPSVPPFPGPIICPSPTPPPSQNPAPGDGQSADRDETAWGGPQPGPGP